MHASARKKRCPGCTRFRGGLKEFEAVKISLTHIRYFYGRGINGKMQRANFQHVRFLHFDGEAQTIRVPRSNKRDRCKEACHTDLRARDKDFREVPAT